MSRPTEELLARALDLEIAEASRAAARAELEATPEGRAALADHEALWDALGELDGPANADDLFTQRVLSEAERQDRRVGRFRLVRGMGPSLAASLLILVAAFAWWSHQEQVREQDADVVRYLHLLQALDVVDRFGEELDLRTEVEIHRAFDGELDAR